MDSSCIDAYLTRLWLDNKDVARVVYLPTRFQSDLAKEGDPDPGFAQYLREFVGLEGDDDGNLWRERPYAMVIFEASREHYFVAVFDFAVECVNVYGRYYDRAFHFHGWQDYLEVRKNEGCKWVKGDHWRGQVMFRNLKQVLCNQRTTAVPTCETVNWLQVWVLVSKLAVADGFKP